MPTKKPRITAIVEQGTKDKVKAIAKDMKVSESVVAGKFIEAILIMGKSERPK